MHNITINELRNKITSLDWDFTNNDTSPINKIHPYPAKFIEQIPDQLLDVFQVPEDLMILDPFIGSGTTAVSAQRHGNQFLGIDLNPIAILITSVKTHDLPKNYLEIVQFITSRSLDLFRSGNFNSVKISNGDHWFSHSVHAMLSCIIEIIRNTKEIGVNVRNALEVALSSIIVKVSYQESDTRYAAKLNQNDQSSVINEFYSANQKIFNAVRDESQKISSKIDDNNNELILGSALDSDISEYKGQVGAVITSPPYPNAYEYWLYHKFRMEFLGYNPKDVKKREIGTRSRYFKKVPESIDIFRAQIAQVIQKAMYVLVSGGPIAIVVGTSVIHGELFDNGQDIQNIGSKLGLEFVARIKRNINLSKKSFNVKNSRLSKEDLIVFRKGDD